MASWHKHIEGQTVEYINIESENQKSGLIILLVLFHSACPYKNYCLKCFTELQTLFIYLFIYLFKFFFFFYLVSNYSVVYTIGLTSNRHLCYRAEHQAETITVLSSFGRHLRSLSTLLLTLTSTLLSRSSFKHV